MDIKKVFLDSNKGDVDVRLFINENGEYVMCPYGRSPKRQWIGMAKLDYFVTGNYKTDEEEVIVKNILDCINVGANYDKLNVGKCTNEEDLVTKCLSQAKRNKFQNFHVVSVDLSDTNEYVEGVEWERVGKTGSEWRGNPDTVKSLNYEDFTKKIVETINAFIKTPIR